MWYHAVMLYCVMLSLCGSLTGVNNELLSEMTNRQGFRKRLAEPCWSHISNCGRTIEILI